MKCKEAAEKLGHSLFALQDGGGCFAAHYTVEQALSEKAPFKRYGQSLSCNDNGRGGWWANNVYFLASHLIYDFSVIGNSAINLGCWQDAQIRAIPNIEIAAGLTDNYQTRPDAINKCREAAAKLGHSLFALQHGGGCFAASYTIEEALSAKAGFKKYGLTSHCNPNGKGGDWTNQVYFMVTRPHYKMIGKDTLDLGCWADDRNSRAIPIIEGSAGLTGNYQTRPDAINRCKEAAAKLGYSLYALQHGGGCQAAAYTLHEALSAEAAFKKYGKSIHCNENGKGGDWTNQVYFSLPVW